MFLEGTNDYSGRMFLHLPPNNGYWGSMESLDDRSPGHNFVISFGRTRQPDSANPSPSASTKSHANGKIKNRSFRISRMGSDVFFDADFESPHMT